MEQWLLLQQALKIRERVFGMEHLRTRTVVEHIARALTNWDDGKKPPH